MNLKKTFKNSFSSILNNCIGIMAGLIAQTFFIKILGSEFLGLSSLFSNVVSMLGIVELGLGSAIIYNLYKPMAEKDIESLKSLTKFYKSTYNVIVLIIIIISIIIVPFLKYLISDMTISVNIYIVYFLFILDVVCSYVLCYKRSLLYAEQNNYIINYTHILYVIILNVLRIMVLYITRNYYIYLIIKIIMTLVENLFLSSIVDRKYAFIKDKNIIPLDKKSKNEIFFKIKSLFFYKIGSFIVSSTDNIIISRYLGLTVVGLYSNYYLIINSLNTLISQAITAVTSNVGRLLIENNFNKNFSVFKKIRFINFWLATFTATCLYVIMDSFVIIWLGREFLLSELTLIVLVINYFQSIMRSTFSTFKEAAGIYEKDRFIPILQALTNVIASIIFVKLIGLPGIFIGTIISELYWWLYSYPVLIYKNLFNKKYSSYFLETLGYLLCFLIILFLTKFISNQFITNLEVIKFITNVLISIIVPNVLLILIFMKNSNFKYFLEMIKKIINKLFVRS